MAFELTFGPIPRGQGVLHRCDNPPCCNPAHLFLGDQSANMADAAHKGRARGAEGEQNWNSTLTTADVHIIRRLSAAGVPRKHIAAKFKVTPQHVGAIVRRQARKAA